MAEGKEKLQFLSCNVCGGEGLVNDQLCHNCRGLGVLAYLDGYLLYWPKMINRQYLKLYKVQKLINTISTVVLVIIGLLGLSSALYFYYLNGFDLLLQYHSYFNKSPLLLYFYISLIFDLYLIFKTSRAKEKHEMVETKKYRSDESEIGARPPLSFVEAQKFPHNKKIDITKAFDTEVWQAIIYAYELAERYKHPEILPIDFVLALLFRNKKVNLILHRLGVDFNILGDKLATVLATAPVSQGSVAFSLNTKKVLFKAYKEAYLGKQLFVGSLELFLAAVKEDQKIGEVLFDLNITMEKLENVVIWKRINEFLINRFSKYQSAARLKSKSGIDRAMTATATQFLNQFSEDYTQLARSGYLDPCIGREKELNEIFRLIEGGQNALVLVGQPGTGKTTIVEGLAQQMIADDVPEILKDKRLVSLSVSALVSGASASDAQQRMMRIINDIYQARNVVLFIDNIQEMIGISAGGAGGGLDLSEVLAEALNKKAFICICATNNLSYSQDVENTTLGHVLAKVTVEEPEINQAIQILEGKVSYVESKNHVYFSYDAIDKAVTLSDRYIHDKFLPQKALLILEEAAVSVRNTKGENQMVSGEDVAKLISEKINMPLTSISTSESEKLLNLEKYIHDRVIGQDEAVSAVAASLRRARAELRDVNRPIVNLLFLGPTGVGKTELTKTIAEVYFGSEDTMVRLDMSEYQDKSSINRLIGTVDNPSGILTESVRKNPYTIVLLDELEKAHPDILNVFLQVMDDGRLTDAAGRTIDFTNAMIIATSNAGTSFIQEKIKQGVSLDQIKKELIETELKNYFKPEFLNRFDNIIVFKPLELPEIEKITAILLKKVAKNLESKGITFKASEAAVKELAQIGYDPLFGARPLRRAIQDKVDNALANYLLQGKIGRRDVAVLEGGGVIKIEKASEL